MYKLLGEAVETALCAKTAGGECKSLRGRHRAGFYSFENRRRSARRLEY